MQSRVRGFLFQHQTKGKLCPLKLVGYCRKKFVPESPPWFGYLIVAIVAYYILQAVVPFLIIAVVGLVIWRVYELHKGR
jgi:hypothetical protein